MITMSDVIIEKKNEVHLKLHCDPHILYELQPYFTFEVESAKFMSQYRSRHWDGKDSSVKHSYWRDLRWVIR
jgi:hypothetical protein